MDLNSYSSFIQLTATLYLACMVLHNISSRRLGSDPFTRFLSKAKVNKINISYEERKQLVNLTVLSLSKIMRDDPKRELLEKRKGYLSLLYDYKRPLEDQRKSTFVSYQKTLEPLDYFAYLSTYMFLFCIGCLLVIPSKYFLGISSYRIITLFSTISLIYCFSFYDIYKKHKKKPTRFMAYVSNSLFGGSKTVHSYILAVLHFFIFFAISFGLSFILPSIGLSSSILRVFIPFLLVFTILFGFLYHVFIFLRNSCKVKPNVKYLSECDRLIKEIRDHTNHDGWDDVNPGLLKLEKSS